jgi:hypothetical protein
MVTFIIVLLKHLPVCDAHGTYRSTMNDILHYSTTVSYNTLIICIYDDAILYSCVEVFQLIKVKLPKAKNLNYIAQP